MTEGGDDGNADAEGHYIDQGTTKCGSRPHMGSLTEFGGRRNVSKTK